VPPDLEVKPLNRRVLPPCQLRGCQPDLHFGIRHVGIEKCTAIRPCLMHGTASAEKPVTMAIGLARRNKRGETRAGQGPEMVLRPGKDIFTRRAKAAQIGRGQAAR